MSFVVFFKKLFPWKKFIGRLWLDSENRVYTIKELDRRTGQVLLIRNFMCCHLIFNSSLKFASLQCVNACVFSGDHFVIEIAKGVLEIERKQNQSIVV